MKQNFIYGEGTNLRQRKKHDLDYRAFPGKSSTTFFPIPLLPQDTHLSSFVFSQREYLSQSSSPPQRVTHFSLAIFHKYSRYTRQ